MRLIYCPNLFIFDQVCYVVDEQNDYQMIKFKMDEMEESLLNICNEYKIYDIVLSGKNNGFYLNQIKHDIEKYAETKYNLTDIKITIQEQENIYV